MVGGDGQGAKLSMVARCWQVYLPIAVVCTAVYLKCLFYGITRSDDDALLASNLPFLRYFPNILKVFTTDAFYEVKSIDLYRPLQSATFIIDAQWGASPIFNAHLTNLLLHILSCLAVFHLLEMLNYRRRIALLGALIYATHYLFMTAVAWLPARGDLLLALFTFLTMISFIKLIETGGLRFYLLHFLCFALAIFSKESAVVLPLLLAVYVWAYSKKALLTKRMMLLPVYYAAVQLAYFTLKSKAVVSYERDIGVLSFIKNLRTFPEMVARFYVPVNMSTLPAFKLYATLTGILLLAGLTTLHVYARRKLDRQVLFACAWFVLFIVPAMTYFPVFYYFAFEHVDHRAYVTCFGLLLLNLNLIQRFELDSLKYFRHVVLLLLAYLTALNLYFSRNYRDPSAFALRAIKTNPKSAQAFSLYGNELYLQGREDEALENLSRSIRILRKFMPALHTRALIYRGRGLNREALADLDTLLATDPGYSPDDYSLRGYIRIDLEDYAGAMADFSSALRLKPDHAEALKALEELRRTVRNNQLLPEVKSALEYNRSGLEAAGRGDFAAAAALFRKALLSDPGFYEVNLNLGNSLYELDRKDEACAAWEVAAAHGNDSSAGRLKQYCQR